MSLDRDFISLAKAKEEAVVLAKRIAELELVVIAAMDAAHLDKFASPNDAVKGTLVKAMRVVTDYDALEKLLSPAQWKRVTKPVLDKEKLEAEIVVGRIDASVVASVSEEKPNKPYLRITGSTDTVTVPSVIGVKAKARTVRVPAAKPRP